jgi:hypothetical protein
MRRIDGGIAEVLGIEFTGNPDTKDYCEKSGVNPVDPLLGQQTDGQRDLSRGQSGSVLETPGRFLVDSIT